MTTEDFIIELFCRLDDKMTGIRKHSQALLHPSEIVTLGLLFALKDGSNRAFYRWLKRDWMHLFPHLPDRTRLFRLFKTHQDWTNRFLAEPSLLGVIDSYGIELIHPAREGRSPKQLGKKGYSNYRWIVGAKLCLLVNHLGRIVAWDCATANTHDSYFRPLIEQVQEQMIVLADFGFHSKDGDPPNLKLCQPKAWNVHMLLETVLSMLTLIAHLMKVAYRVMDYLRARLAFTVAIFNLLVDWDGLQSDDNEFVPLSIANFSL